MPVSKYMQGSLWADQEGLELLTELILPGS